MTDLVKQITNDLQKKIESFEPKIGIADIGTVLEAGDGIARASGLANVRSQELVQFANGVMGIAFNLEKDVVGIIIMGDYAEIAEGMGVRATGRIASVPVGDGLIGRVVNALGEPVDGKGPLPRGPQAYPLKAPPPPQPKPPPRARQQRGRPPGQQPPRHVGEIGERHDGHHGVRRQYRRQYRGRHHDRPGGEADGVAAAGASALY